MMHKSEVFAWGNMLAAVSDALIEMGASPHDVSRMLDKIDSANQEFMPPRDAEAYGEIVQSIRQHGLNRLLRPVELPLSAPLRR